MVKLDFKKYDVTSTMEQIIESTIRHFRLNSIVITLKTEEKQKQLILTIISILYKLKCYQEYLKENIAEFEQDENIKILYEIIDKFSKNIEDNDIKQATILLKTMGSYIQVFLEMYFERKNANYIAEKSYIKYVIDQKNQKEYLEYNPYVINQLLQYIQNPLTPEETIISEIIEYEVETEQLYNRQEKVLRHIKKLMKTHNDEETYSDKIAFIISNVYQEVIEDYNDENRSIIKGIIENEEMDRNAVIEQFKTSDTFSNMILKTFLLHNREIEEGHLEELKTKESKQFAKRIYDK